MRLQAMRTEPVSSMSASSMAIFSSKNGSSRVRVTLISVRAQLLVVILQKCLIILRRVGIVKNTGVAHRHMADRRVQCIDGAAQAAFARPVQDRRNQTAGEEEWDGLLRRCRQGWRSLSLTQ